MDLGIEHQEANVVLAYVWAASDMLRKARQHAKDRDTKRQLGGHIAALEEIEDHARDCALRLRGKIKV